ncbi:co-chaperone DjlA [Psychromonas sp. RZ22]|uniref:co-chaperone DjlA n=1 Tax=Psychromonas algarum TaxID=2555643 RepID=UPI0010672040|nr:co-chaperone DjlA [Psychromonas sp. RZ22]TEW54403.1 co-chaperone DjlA [Psychromonas sp. RZ22]
MRIWGKLLGGFFGFMFGHFFGLILGVWLGHKFDTAVGRNFNMQDGMLGGRANSIAKQKVFFETTFSVMGHVAKSKGQVTSTDIHIANAYMDQMNLHGEARVQAQTAFTEGKKADFALTEVLQAFVQTLHGERNVLQMFLAIQVQVAFSDGHIDDNEKVILYTIAETLGFSRFELDRLIQMIEGQSQFHRGNSNGGQQFNKAQVEEDAYKVLGVDSSATDKEIKRAYRKLMSQNHPDKLASKGLPEEMMELANEKAQDIQKAYEVLRSSRGFK